VSHIDDTSNIIWSIVDGEAVLLDTSSGGYFSLNPQATEIWEHLQGGHSLSDIIGMLTQKYKMDNEIVSRDVVELIGELRTSRLWD